MTDPVVPTPPGGTVPPNAGGAATTGSPSTTSVPEAAGSPSTTGAPEVAGSPSTTSAPEAAGSPSTTGAPGFPPPNAGAPGFPPPNAGAPGFPAAGEAVPPPVPPKKSFGKKVLGVLGTLVIIVVVIGLKTGLASMFRSDPTEDAKAGDCISVGDSLGAAASEVEAKIVECSSADAAYTMLDRVEGVSDVNSTACDAAFEAKLKEGEAGAVIASEEGKGYLLCLKAN
ncbi:hypothetical protein [Actinoplanes sp. NBRC 101535]|uniref:LppU/SCO3897 family protein n=1 Tax=Actinoplanes sp. NBRC 101535 TaxID=3032196 RepID=UPI0024A3BB0D|nr:hypothetical protein [Actinoplanes sp. NBRC 101535]GLY01086.1 hypothetical protein Acsp01_14650 [Actinoplanes sp. NBRC 101535]